MVRDGQPLVERARARVGTVMGLAVALLVAGCREPTRPTLAPATPTAADATLSATAGAARGPVSPQATTSSPARPSPSTLPATVTSTPRLSAVFSADVPEVESGACCWLRWRLPGARQVTLDDQEAPASGTRRVCLSETTVYRLRWLGPDGEPESRAVTVTVRAPALTLAIVPPRFEERPKPTAPKREPPDSRTPTECTPCAGATRRPTATRPPPATDLPPPSDTPLAPTAAVSTAEPSATDVAVTPEPPPLPTAGESPTAQTAP